MLNSLSHIPPAIGNILNTASGFKTCLAKPLSLINGWTHYFDAKETVPLAFREISAQMSLVAGVLTAFEFFTSDIFVRGFNAPQTLTRSYIVLREDGQKVVAKTNIEPTALRIQNVINKASFFSDLAGTLSYLEESGVSLRGMTSYLATPDALVNGAIAALSIWDECLFLKDVIYTRGSAPTTHHIHYQTSTTDNVDLADRTTILSRTADQLGWIAPEELVISFLKITASVAGIAMTLLVLTSKKREGAILVSKTFLISSLVIKRFVEEFTVKGRAPTPIPAGL